jgi:hypothetical protein
LMETADDLAVPNGAEEEARAPPAIASLANVIAALAGSEGLVSPKRFEVAVTAAQGVGNLLGEPSLTRVLTFRALAAPQDPRAAIATLKRHTPALPPPDRAAVMRALAELIGDDAKPSVAGLAPDLAAALGVPLPVHLRRTGGGIRDGLAHLTERAMRLVRHEAPLIAASRDFATTFGEPGLLTAVEDAERVGDNRLLNDALRSTLENVRERVGAIIQAAETQSEALQIAQELERAAEEIERVARQRYAAITRRAKMLKRHLREDLHALAENAAEEFEVDFRRLA